MSTEFLFQFPTGFSLNKMWLSKEEYEEDFQFPTGFSPTDLIACPGCDIANFQFPTGFSLNIKYSADGSVMVFQFPTGFSLGRHGSWVEGIITFNSLPDSHASLQ